MEELGQLVLAVAFILFYAISGSKRKKKKPVPPAVRRRPQQAPPKVVRPADAVERPDIKPEPPDVLAEWQVADNTPPQADRPVERKRTLAEELLGMMQEQVKPVPVPAVQLPEVDDEAQSLETVESTDLQSPEPIRRSPVENVPADSPYAVEDTKVPRPYAVDEVPDERPYVIEETRAPQPYAIPDSPRRKRDLSRSELRHAFVMREVLGPPKALE